MHPSLLLLLPYLPFGASETILGAYIFHRHGDRSSKSYPPVLLTSQGVDQMYRSGSWYRSRYVQDKASSQIHGISSDSAVLSQLSVTSPADDVLQNSAQAFLQGLYPPVIKTSSNQTSTEEHIPGLLEGYQYIPVNTVGFPSNNVRAEDNIGLQSGSACPKAIASTESYFESSDYLLKLKDTTDFYQTLLPVYGETFSRDEATFKHAYASMLTQHGRTLEVSEAQNRLANTMFSL